MHRNWSRNPPDQIQPWIRPKSDQKWTQKTTQVDLEIGPEVNFNSGVNEPKIGPEKSLNSPVNEPQIGPETDTKTTQINPKIGPEFGMKTIRTDLENRTQNGSRFNDKRTQIWPNSKLKREMKPKIGPKIRPYKNEKSWPKFGPSSTVRKL